MGLYAFTKGREKAEKPMLRTGRRSTMQTMAETAAPRSWIEDKLLMDSRLANTCAAW